MIRHMREVTETLAKCTNKRTTLFGLLCVGLISPTMVAAEQITLSLEDGETIITGEYLDFQDDNYLLLTNLGEIRVPSAGLKCEGDPCSDLEASKVDIRIAGSDIIGVGIMPIVMQVYGEVLNAESAVTETENSGQYLVNYIGDDGFGDNLGSHYVNSSNTGDAFKALLEKSAEIGMASRRVTREEARALSNSGAGSMVDPDQEHVIAVDSIVVITHPDNPVDILTVSDLAKIYSGEITNWSELGGSDLPIVVVHRDTESGTGAVFSERILGAPDAELTKAAVRMSDDSSVAAIVSAEPSVIGFVGYGFQRGNQSVTLTSSCGISMSPDAFSARTEEYILQRRLYLYSRADTKSDDVENFLEVVTSAQVDGAILKSGFVDLGVDRRAMSDDGERAKALVASDSGAYESQWIQEMLGEMVGYDRLSTTFRFATGSSRLDERALVDLERLAGYLETLPEGTGIQFIGFTDDVGAFDGNLNLSENRAQQVMTEFKNYIGDRLSSIQMGANGYSEISPAGCNDSADGRRINRRVEVWVKNSTG